MPSTIEDELMEEIYAYAVLYPNRLWQNPGDLADGRWQDGERERRQGIIDGMALAIFHGTASRTDIQDMVRKLINVARDNLERQNNGDEAP